MRKGTILLLIFILSALFLSCNFPAPSKLYGLLGEWSITERPTDTVADYTNYAKFIFSIDKYEIEDKDGKIFESGPISNVTNGSYDYVMEQFDPAPEYQGSEDCAVFSIDGDILTITFYSRDKSENYGTLKAQKL